MTLILIKIRVSDKKLYNKEHNSYKYYVFYGHSNEYIPLRIILKDFVGYYDDSLLKIISIFEHIEEKLGIDLGSYFYEDKRREKYLKTNASQEIFFKDNIIPKENTKYDCRVILRIQSVYYSIKIKMM